MPKTYAFLAVACLIGCLPAGAQEIAPASPQPAAPPPQVLVSSLKDPYKIAYRNIVKALTAQDDNPRLAPHARTRWMMFSKDGTPVTQPLSITIAGTNGQVPVAQDSTLGNDTLVTLAFQDAD